MNFDQATFVLPKRPPLPEKDWCQECGYWPFPVMKAVAPDLAEHYCRCEERRREAQEMRRHLANLPRWPTGRRTFDNFRVSPETSKMRRAAAEFAGGLGPHVLVLTGDVGCGKTHLMEAIGWHVLEQGGHVRYEFTSSLLERLRHSYKVENGEDTYDILQSYQRMKVLLLDDVGVERGTDWVREKLTAVVDERLRNGRRTALATNLTDGQMADAVGPRLASRLYAVNPELRDVRLVICEAHSYRR